MMRIRSRLWLVIAGLGITGCGAADQPEPEGHGDEGSSDVVFLDADQLASAFLEFGTLQILAPDTLRLTGIVTFDAARVSHVGPRMQGRIGRVPVEIGSSVRAGDTLVVLDSPELGAAQAAWFTASIKQDVDRRNYERAERLYRDGIVSERRRLEAEAEFRQAEGALTAAARALAALGAEPDSSASSLFVLRAPLSGVVADKHATIGEVVGSDARLFTVADLTQLWILLDVYETDLPRVDVGAPAIIRTEAYPDRLFDGAVGYVGAIVDTTSRTVKVRVELSNPDLALKPGMFARANLVLHDRDELVGIPESAIQTVDGRTVVFVPEGDGQFRVTPVEAGPVRTGAWVEILGGLDLGETVVTSGSFSLKSELMKESFGEGGHE